MIDEIKIGSLVITSRSRYGIKYCDKLIETSDEIAIEKGTVLFDSNSYDNKTLITIISDKICKKINQVVKITKILIS